MMRVSAPVMNSVTQPTRQRWPVSTAAWELLDAEVFRLKEEIARLLNSRR